MKKLNLCPIFECLLMTCQKLFFFINWWMCAKAHIKLDVLLKL